MKKEKTKKGFIIFFVVVAVIYALLLELSKNTIPGWVLAAAVFAGFFFLHKTLLAEKKILAKLLSWLCLALVLLAVYGISYPPYKTVPAVTAKNPQVTDVVTVAQGDLTGVYNEDQTVEVYTGIPYAKPPVGDLRWKEPAAPESWEGVRTCDRFAPMFMQSENSTLWNSLVDIVIYNKFNWFDLSDNYREAKSEDALYINIWKPAGDISDAPVLFYVHGGSLQTGQPSFNQYNGEEYAKRGIVFVDFGYRLNVFGYYADEALAAESPNGTTGNYGLLDQIAALKWVNENIAAFGGDAGNITIAGESAGSSSVNALCVSPLTKGMFRRAIGESSSIVARTPFHTFRSYADALAMKQEVFDAMGVSSVEELRKIDATKLVEAAGDYNSMTVDGYAITEQPYLTYEKGENHEEALLSGYNAHEADVFTILGTDVNEDNYSQILEYQFGDYADEVEAIYPSDGKNAKEQYNKAMSAAWFAYSHYTWSRLMADEGRPAYEYWFTKENKSLSTNHAGELPYFYGNLKTMAYNYTDSDFALSETIMDYVENFCRTGDPNGGGLPTWPLFDEDRTKVLEFGENLGMVTDPYLDMYKVLDEMQGFKD